MLEQQRKALVLEALRMNWPDARCELLARDPWDLLVAVILSSRTSDERVNQVMAVLTEHFVGPAAYASLDPHELEPMIDRVPFYSQKARSIVESARMIETHYNGEVPADPQELQRLPGVGAKTAAVVLGNAFGIPAVAVDVHVQRVAQRLGWTSVDADPRSIEHTIMTTIDPQHWVQLCHRMIRLGRAHCRPKRPWCSRCPLHDTCRQQGVDDSR